jgi:hypothetical protein
MFQIDLLHAVIGLFGLVLILNATFIIFSSKYYSYFTKSLFIEPISSEGRENFNLYLEKEKDAQRYGLSAVSILMGVIAIAWTFGINLTYWG